LLGTIATARSQQFLRIRKGAYSTTETMIFRNLSVKIASLKEEILSTKTKGNTVSETFRVGATQAIKSNPINCFKTTETFDKVVFQHSEVLS
jgi:hypothetical protein